MGLVPPVVHLLLLVHPLFSSTVSGQCWRGPRGQGGVDNQAGGLNSRLDRRDSTFDSTFDPSLEINDPSSPFSSRSALSPDRQLTTCQPTSPTNPYGQFSSRTAVRPGSKSSRLVDQPDTYRPPKTSNKLTLTYPIPELRRPPLFHRTVSSRLPSSRPQTSLAPHDSTCRLDLVPRLQSRTSRSGDYLTKSGRLPRYNPLGCPTAVACSLRTPSSLCCAASSAQPVPYCSV
jgi:hypothetical protein